MELNLRNKKVFVTASTSGIGKATANAFLREGAIVVLNGRNIGKLDQVLCEFRDIYGEERVFGIRGDMSDEMQIKSVIKKVADDVKEIDVVVGNLGTGKPISGDKFDLEEWKYMLKINLLSAVGLIQNTCNLFPEYGGSIVLLSSLAAHDRIGAPPAYAAAKAGVVSLVKYAAPFLMERNIRINAVSPGNIYFEGGRWEELLAQKTEETREYIEREVPMKRFGKAEEIAESVLFLSSEKSGFTTGTVLQVDGGQGKGI